MALQYAITVGSAPRGGPIRVPGCTLTSVFLTAALVGAAIAQTTTAQSGGNAAPEVSIEAEVLENIRAQSIGPAQVSDLALPDEFLRRIADRIVRSSYEERFRIVVSGEHAREPAPPQGVVGTQSTGAQPKVDVTQILLWTCLGGLLAVFAGLVWKGRRRMSP